MTNTLDTISEEFTKILLPLKSGFSSPAEAEALLKLLGWKLPPGLKDIGLTGIDLKALIEKFEILIASTPEEREDFELMASRYAEVLGAAIILGNNIANVMKAISNLQGLPSDYLSKTKIHEKLYLRLLDFLIIEYFKHSHYSQYCFFVLLGIFELTIETGNTSDYSVDYIKHEIIYSRITQVFSDPKKLFQEVYGWETPSFKSVDLLINFAMLLESFGALIEVKKMRPNWEELFLARPVPEALINPMPQVDLALMQSLERNGVEVGLSAFGLRKTTQTGTDGGIGIAPYIRGTTEIEFPITPRLFFEIDTTLDVQGGIALLMRAGKDIALKVDLLSSDQGTALVSGKILFTLRLGSNTSIPLTLISIPGGTRVQSQQIFITAGAGISGNKDLDLIVEGGLRGGKLIITAGEGDGFLKKILPAEAIELDFDIIIGYSSKTGVYFKGSSALEIRFPVHFVLGPIGIEGLTITLKPENGKIPIALGADITAKLGPLSAVVENMGASASFSFPADQKGNAGPLQIDLGFKPPSAIGLSLDTSAVKAGGFLQIKPDEYIGALELEIKAIKLAIKAIAIINTKLPGGEPGFSLLVIITAEFSPITLVFGFTLNGLGGLFGYKREFNRDELRLGLKTKALDSILFPKNVIANITKIVGDLKNVFPIGNNFLIGPMVKIGWGASLVTAEIGIIIQIPEPIIAILGVIRLQLPDPKDAILKLQINFLGIIDFEKKMLSLDSSLTDSRILTMTLTGEFAVRLGWGFPPVFIFSSGGFHPDFKEAPVELQHMERLGLQIINEEEVKLGVDTYFALTTNTVQIGAHARFWAKSGSYTAQAEVGFDALIQFKPFFFSIAIFLTGKVTGPMIDVVIEVKGNLSGPNPWHTWGFAHAKVLFFEITIPFDKTFGDPIEELSAGIENVLKLLMEEIPKNTNWKTTTVINGISKVSLREITPDPDNMIVHPNTILSFNQRVVPLEVAIHNFGNKGVDEPKKFSITANVPQATVSDTKLYDSFAPGNFFEIGKDQKLSRPSFEQMKSGNEFTIGSSSAAGIAVLKDIDYEVIYIRNKKIADKKEISLLNPDQVVLLASGGAAAKSKLSVENTRVSYQAPPKIMINRPRYIVVKKADHSEVVTEEFGNQAEAYNKRLEFDENETLILSTQEI